MKNPMPGGYNIRDRMGNIQARKFVNTLDQSMELTELRPVYEKVYRRTDFGFWMKKYEYTQRVINVTFKYAVKDFNQLRKNLYVRFGYGFQDIELNDCVCVKDGELIAIEVNKDVATPVKNGLLGKHFAYEDGAYRIKGTMEVTKSKKDLREDLYVNGFDCGGIHYIRYKRSGGSSRVGKCLFIDEKLYSRIHRWEMCGIKVKEGQEVDLAALEAYIALPLSSSIGTVEIEPENILVIDDFESIFYDDVIAVRENERVGLVAKPQREKICNSIWDGQSLLDPSLFGEYVQYGMILLRNRFFKSCCFNCDVQKFFADHGITEIGQLKGRTVATDIKDIKMITTPSSIKYLKFGTLESWLENISPVFSVVKHEKKTHFFEGRMVQAHYQLINTLQLDYDEVEKLLEPSLRYLHLLNTDPAVLRFHIKYPHVGEFEMPQTPMESKNDVVYKLLGLNNKFCNTRLYAEFRKDLVRAYVKNLKKGHVLVNGNYETLLGNPVEMLYASVGLFDGSSILGKGNVCTQRFPAGVELLGSRSPHVNPGNVLLVQNVASEEIERYFNLTPEILCLNSIEDNVLQRLNGCDFDSDSILLTDNHILIDAARRNYDKFLVPTNYVSSVKRKRRYTAEQKADLDFKTSENLIGPIINLSQELNTLMWDALNEGASFDDVADIYYDSSKLCIMSGIEIDSAKKEFTVSNADELRKLKAKYCRRDDDGRMVKPNFFGHISKAKGYYDPKKKNYLRHNTAMDYLQQVVNKANHRYRNNNNKKYLDFSEILNNAQFDIRKVQYQYVNRVLDIVRQEKRDIAKVWEDYGADKTHTREDAEVAARASGEIRQECIEYIDNIHFNYSTMYWLLKSLDSSGTKDVRRDVFGILFGVPNRAFYKVIEESAERVPELVEDDFGIIDIYGKRYSYLAE